ncbi:unnamed protein product [Cylicocyclus nassatus]|uniref:Uncharacterized protein n=1 Tax=Cylicocyclus nassatus TaxID=53992 RepID=A0AA36H6Z5_CYLNA|nr:unnamed protein product [Cylicocyclus nassatus]
MSSTVRSLKGLVTKRNDAAVNWLQDSTQALADIQAKESARRIKTCERYIELLETSLTKLTKAFNEAPETTEEEEDHLDKYIEKTQATIMKLHDHRTQLEDTLEDIGIEADDRSSPSALKEKVPTTIASDFSSKNEAMKAAKAQSAASRKKKFSSISIGPVMATASTQQKKFSSSTTEFDTGTDPSVTIALARAQ